MFPDDGRPPRDVTQVSTTPTYFQVTTTSSPVSAANGKRTHLVIQNKTVNDIGVNFGQPAGQNSDYVIYGLREREWSDKVPIDSINIVCRVAGATASGVILEGRWPDRTPV